MIFRYTFTLVFFLISFNFYTQDFDSKKYFDRINELSIEINNYNLLNGSKYELSGFYSSRALCKSIVDDTRGAIMDYLKAIEIQPMTEHYTDLASCYANLKDNVKAIKYYNLAVSYDPDNYLKNYTAIRQRGVLKRKIKDYNGAIADFTLIINMTKLGYVAFLDGYNLRGHTYLEMNEKDKACNDFSRGAQKSIDTFGEGKDFYDLIYKYCK